MPPALRCQRTACQPSLRQQQLVHWKLENARVCCNLSSENFEVLNRKFTAEEVEIFNQRARDVRSLLNRANKKWIFNPYLETQEEFERRRKLNMSAPWEDEKIKAKIQEENADKKHIVYGPKELGKLIDETGIKLGITRTYTFGYKPR